MKKRVEPTKTTYLKPEPGEPVKVTQLPVESVNELDLAVAKAMGLDGTKIPPFSTDKELVNDMAAFANKNDINLPRWTSDPYKIANAIAAWAKEEK